MLARIVVGIRAADSAVEVELLIDAFDDADKLATIWAGHTKDNHSVEEVADEDRLRRNNHAKHLPTVATSLCPSPLLLFN